MKSFLLFTILIGLVLTISHKGHCAWTVITTALKGLAQAAVSIGKLCHINSILKRSGQTNFYTATLFHFRCGADDSNGKLLLALTRNLCYFTRFKQQKQRTSKRAAKISLSKLFITL